MTLQAIPITGQLDWLPAHAQQAAATCPGLPTGYETYLKLLLPVGIDPSVPIASYSFAKRTSADLNARAAFWDTYHIQRGQPEPARLQPITYREVSAQLGLAYEATLDSATIRRHYGEWPPHLGSSAALEEAFVWQLVQLLGPQQPVRWSGASGHGESNFPLSWKQKNQPANGLEKSMIRPFGSKQSAA